ncbi:MAG: PLP-dependent aminotransferase family protein [Rhodocyclales bacterium]|nr:PLP-dependent aminotransferase family protein [Rhodocyclales bacterium]
MVETLRYEKLASDLAALITDGLILQGERLPSVRRLAQERRLSVSTVIQALRQLEDRGLVEARPQSGYFVCHRRLQLAEPETRSPPVAAMPVDISQRLLRVLAASVEPGMAPLAAALPANDLLPIAALHRLYAGVARRHPQLLAAGSHAQMSEAALARQLVRRSLAWGGPLAADEIIVTNGCTEALSLCLRAVTQPGDTVAVESPAYYLMLQLLETLGLKALEIPTDPRLGLSIEAFELASRHGGIAACLLVSNGSNPLGCVMPEDKKRRLAALAVERGIPLIEDDIYGDLHHGEQRPWPIKAFDRSGNVMLCSSFSKSLSPALRIGFVAAGRYRSAVAMHKTISSGGTNPIGQMVLAEFLESSAYERHLRQLRRQYQRQVVAMQDAVARYFPLGSRVSQPQAGYVLWVELPEGIDASLCYEAALQERVTYVPGDLFSASGMYRNCLRLNCGHPHTPEIADAVRRLGAIFSRAAAVL